MFVLITTAISTLIIKIYSFNLDFVSPFRKIQVSLPGFALTPDLSNGKRKFSMKRESKKNCVVTRGDKISKLPSKIYNHPILKFFNWMF